MAKVKTKKKAKGDKSGLDWEVLKDEFFSDLNTDGTYRYANVEEFAAHVAKGNQELYKKVVRSIRHKAYRGYEWRGDWASERLRESGKHDAQVKALQRKIGQEFDLLDVGKDIAQTYIPLQGRIERLFVDLDEIYGGRAVLTMQPEPMPSDKDLKRRKVSKAEFLEGAKLRREAMQSRRFKEYTRCVGHILRLKRSVDEQLLECLGWNRPQFAGLLANMHKKGESTGVTETKVVQVMMQLAHMQLKKAETYDMALPADFKALEKVSGNGHSKHHAEMVDDDDAVANAIPVNNGRNGSKRNGSNGKH